MSYLDIVKRRVTSNRSQYNTEQKKKKDEKYPWITCIIVAAVVILIVCLFVWWFWWRSPEECKDECSDDSILDEMRKVKPTHYYNNVPEGMIDIATLRRMETEVNNTSLECSRNDF